MSRSLRSRSICAPSPPLGNWFSTTVPAEQMGKKLKQRFERAEAAPRHQDRPHRQRRSRARQAARAGLTRRSVNARPCIKKISSRSPHRTARQNKPSQARRARCPGSSAAPREIHRYSIGDRKTPMPSVRRTTGKQVQARFWRQSANDWRALTRPGWDAQVE